VFGRHGKVWKAIGGQILSEREKKRERDKERIWVRENMKSL